MEAWDILTRARLAGDHVARAGALSGGVELQRVRAISMQCVRWPPEAGSQRMRTMIYI